MADHGIAHRKTISREGWPGWVFDLTDRGGETCAGLTRKNHPTWAGWDVVDTVKKALGIGTGAGASPATRKRVNAALLAYSHLWDLVLAEYKPDYWDPLNLDAEPLQGIADAVYDTCVLMGPKPARGAMQGAYDRIRAEHARLGLEPL